MEKHVFWLARLLDSLPIPYIHTTGTVALHRREVPRIRGAGLQRRDRIRFARTSVGLSTLMKEKNCVYLRRTAMAVSMSDDHSPTTVTTTSR
jgi:hypothetical protein